MANLLVATMQFGFKKFALHSHSPVVPLHTPPLLAELQKL